MTRDVWMAKLAWFEPAGIVTFDGIDTTDPELESDTIRPLGPELPFNVTVPVDLAPPTTEFGLTVT